MATAKAFGSITIIDVTDIGEFSVYPMSNLPLSVIYSPDNNTYSPSWTTNNLILTPVVYYAGKSLALGSSGLNISWQKMEGISSATLGSHEVTGSTGILTVNDNQFNENSSLITYTVTATYLEPSSKTTLTAQGQITFSLIKMASEVRDIKITGNNIFKYNSTGACDITQTTLKATLTDTLIIKDWEYSKNDGTSWTSLSNAKIELVIQENSNIFANDRVLIRAVAYDKLDANILYYDYITVFKLRDGTAAGNNIVLSNESQQIPCDSKNAPKTGAFSLAYTSVSIYQSGKDVTSDYEIKAKPSGVIGAWTNSATQMPTGNGNEVTKGTYNYYWVTGWASSNTSDVAEVLFTATKGTEVITKKMSLIKVSTGADGVTPTVYRLDLSDLSVNKSYTYQANTNTVASTTYAPTSITATARQTKGNETSAYAGYIKVFKDGGSEPIASGTATNGSFSLTGIGTTHVPANYLTFELYDGSGASATLLDSQNVIITSDGLKGTTGQQGQPGQAGASALNVVLGNYADVIAVTTGYKVPQQTKITIPFAGYKGTTKIACSASAPTLFGQTASVTNATASADGKIEYTIPTTATVGSSTSKTGTITLTFTIDGTTVTAVYTWSITVAATNGTNAIILQVSTPEGYIFQNGNGTLVIQADLMNGASIQSTGVTYKWEKFANGSYVDVSGGTNKTLTVSGADVDGYASYRCTASYNNNPYYGYASLMDYTDPIQVSIISTVGTQIVNGQGVGALYARVTRNGSEIDVLPENITFVTAKPSSMVAGRYYYYLYKDGSGKGRVALYKASSTTAWAAASDYNYTGTYTWSYRNADNQPITEGIPATDGKVIYIDAGLINKKLIIDVEVDI